MSWMSTLSKNTESTRKTQKNNLLKTKRILNIKIYAKEVPAFIFSLPRVRLTLLTPSVTPLPTGWHSLGRVCEAGVVASNLLSCRFHVLSRSFHF